jgi:hypothetical protein
VAVTASSYEYEVCFKCHSDNPATSRYIKRYRGNGNRRFDFATSNVSYHPVEAAGKNLSVTSLLTPYTVNSKIYCSDCHSSDGNNAPAGPHGSSYPGMLKAAYDTTRFALMGTGWNSSTINARWPLCFQCHNLTTTTNIHSAIHSGHFLKYIGCIVCHDSHGYDGAPAPVGGGGISYAFTKLVNFDTSIIRPNATNGKLIDIAGKKCYMVCHQNPSGSGGVYHAHSSNGSNF